MSCEFTEGFDVIHRRVAGEAVSAGEETDHMQPARAADKHGKCPCSSMCSLMSQT
jgi:hypothetical protein